MHGPFLICLSELSNKSDRSFSLDLYSFLIRGIHEDGIQLPNVDICTKALVVDVPSVPPEALARLTRMKEQSAPAVKYPQVEFHFFAGRIDVRPPAIVARVAVRREGRGNKDRALVEGLPNRGGLLTQ